MSEFHVAARVKLKEGFDMSRLKMELANGLEEDYRLKNIDLKDDITEPVKAAAQIEQPTHILTYELSGEITQKEIKLFFNNVRKAFCLKQNAFLICLALNMRSHLCPNPPALAGGRLRRVSGFIVVAVVLHR